MRALKNVLQENPNTVTGEDLKRVDRWFDENSSAAKAFEASLEATTVVRSDLLKVVAAITAIVNGGLTREALVVLLQARIGNQRNGRPMPSSTINDVLDAMMGLDVYVTKEGAMRGVP